jgi:YihY family inner membrane protein
MFNWLYGPNLVTKADRLSTYAAALAYNVVLSMVPFLAVTFVLGMQISLKLDLSKTYTRDFIHIFNEVIPMGNQIVNEKSFEAVEHSSFGGFIPIGFILALYTSFSLMEQIIRTVTFIFDDPRRPQTWSWWVIVKTLTLLGIWMLLLLLIAISAVESSVLRNNLNEFIFSAFTKDFVELLQVVVVIMALFLTFFLTYSLVSARRFKTNKIVEGALVASCGWVACSLLFVTVLPKILQTSAAYIALGSVVAILLWAQACAWSVIIGACWIVRFSPRPKSV